MFTILFTDRSDNTTEIMICNSQGDVLRHAVDRNGEEAENAYLVGQSDLFPVACVGDISATIEAAMIMLRGR
jgi:hypothetical protein